MELLGVPCLSRGVDFLGIFGKGGASADKQWTSAVPVQHPPRPSGTQKNYRSPLTPCSLLRSADKLLACHLTSRIFQPGSLVFNSCLIPSTFMHIPARSNPLNSGVVGKRFLFHEMERGILWDSGVRHHSCFQMFRLNSAYSRWLVSSVAI